MIRFFGAAALIFALVLAAGCAPSVRPAAAPIDQAFYGASEKTGTLIVFLPGRDDNVTAFEQNGLVEALRQQNTIADAVSVDAHFGYYVEKKLVGRLKEDIISPARAAGYDRIWLVGTSLGSLGALLYLEYHPEEISGVVLLGPYLGDQPIIDEINRSGGLASWSPGEVMHDDWQRHIWKGLKGLRAKDLPPIYLGYGREDRYRGGAELFGSLLPADRVLSVSGGHNWQVWNSLWRSFLAKGAL